MLVLSRRRDEQIVVGEGESQVVITVIEVRGDRVRIGVEARKDIEIHRKEVYDVIHKADNTNEIERGSEQP
jgi:carbon storage regulator